MSWNFGDKDVGNVARFLVKCLTGTKGLSVDIPGSYSCLYSVNSYVIITLKDIMLQATCIDREGRLFMEAIRVDSRKGVAVELLSRFFCITMKMDVTYAFLKKVIFLDD